MRASGILAAAAVLALGLAGIAPSHATTITIVNGDGAGEGFNDNSSSPNTGGTGTRGQQRLAVFQAAANQWAALLDSNVPIRVQAFFDPLECDAESAVLGSAGPLEAIQFPGSPRANTLYPVALANAIRGFDSSVGVDDIRARFNSTLDGGGCLGGSTWWYGTDPSVPVPVGKVALLPVVFHELAHGLGFLSFTDPSTGAFLGATRDVWAFNQFDREQNRLWTAMTNAQRMQSAINDPDLVWNGTHVTAQIPQFLRPPATLHVLAPAGIAGDKETQPASFGPAPPAAGLGGTVVKAIDGTTPANDACSALQNAAQMAGRIALIARGNCNFTEKVKNAQIAGAIGAIIYNNAAGLPAMGGVDPSVQIPSYGISQADGTAMNAFSDNTVSVNLGYDTGAPPAGTSGGFVRLYAPNPVEPGSSVSHFTDAAFPDLLMEPALNQSLFDRVDLTLALFKDIGWPLEPNDAPTISAPASLAGTEDTVRNVTGITFADPDAGPASIVQATFAVPSGAVTATSTASVTVSGTDTARVLRGTLANVNAFIAGNGVKYVPVANANGTIALTITIDDLGNTGDGGPETATRNVNLVLAAVNDAPSVAAPNPMAITEDTPGALTAITVADPDAGTGTTTLGLSVPAGTLAATAQGGDNVTVAGGGGTLTLSGTIAALNAFIGNGRVRYTPAANASGNVPLSLSISDNGNTGTGGAASAQATATIAIAAINDAPTLAAPASLTTAGGIVAVTGVTLADVDAGTANVSLRFTAGSGTVSTTSAGSGIAVTGNGTAVMTLVGTVGAIQTFLDAGGVRYTAGSGNTTLTLLANDNGNTGAGGALTATKTIAILVPAVNTAPSVTAPATIDVGIAGATALRELVLADADAGAGVLTLTASVNAGTLSAAGAGVTVGGDGTASITLSGTLSALNALIAGGGFAYTPAAGQDADATLQLVLNDNGNTGTGGALTGSDSATLVLSILFADGFE